MSNKFITSELLKDDPELIGLVDRFISRLPSMQEEINKAFDDHGWEIFANLIHQMKGVGGNYGYPILTSTCFDIEENVEKENIDEIKNQLGEFKVVCEQIIAGSEENHKMVG